MTKKLSLLALLLQLSIFACQNPSDSTLSSQRTTGNMDPQATSGWNIPENDIISGGVPKDGIPSLFNPVKISAAQANYLSDDDLVLGIVVDDMAIAYPHTILDWHEVVNEDIGDKTFTVSYCPLTGTAIVFDGKNAGRKLKFGYFFI